MVVGLKRRKMISRRKRKTTAQRMLELMQRHGATQKQVQRDLALSTFGGGTLSPSDEALLNLPPINKRTTRLAKIQRAQLPPLSIAAKTKKAALRHQRKRIMAGAEAAQQGRMLKSSWVNHLSYIQEGDEDTGKVHVLFNDRKYTYFNVPESLFNAWFAGGATTTTEDTRKVKRWKIHDPFSLGAFFNQYIKPKWGKHAVHGWV